MAQTLPIHAALPALLAALSAKGRAVLQAPPGAGKTTVVPLALLEHGISGRIVMLEPRRLAARAAAERMAETLGEPVGQTVGYRVRGEAKVSAATRIEVVTTGILTRRIQSDPGLEGIGAVLFDEFHERSLDSDLGLALCLEIRAALRPDLHLLVMSATLDAAPVAALMDDAPVITSEGRTYPVTTVHLDRPRPKAQRREAALADLTCRALDETTGGVLVFLPGAGQITRLAALLKDRMPGGTHIRPLFGAMEFAAQRAAMAPAPSGRKVVLATSIAETSLTIEDIRAVVDGGLARRARMTGAGMSRLVTEPVSRAEATQRQGRAGRVAPGTCYRLWTRAEEGALPAFPPAEIETADLAPLALELALWGARPEAMPFLTQPPQGPYAEAKALLEMLGALDARGQITDHGRALAGLPLHPRLAHMLALAGPDGALLAALLAERDPLPHSAPSDLALRLKALRRPKADHPYTPNRATLQRITAEAKRLSSSAKTTRTGPKPAPLSDAAMAALAYPDRISLRRPGDDPRYLLSGGKGAHLASDDTLANTRLLVATELDGNPREARIRQAIPLPETDLRALFGDKIAWHDICDWSARDRRIRARSQERFGAITLQDRHWKDAPDAAHRRAMLDGIRSLGLSWSAPARLFAARVRLLRAQHPDLPDLSDAALMESAADWLLPYLGGLRSAEDWKRFDMTNALRARLDYDQMRRVDVGAPAYFTTPLGRKIPIDYATEPPEIQLRLQEMFGQTRHPDVGGTPLRVTLLSPAGRPVQTTLDIPGFWNSSYSDVRKDMRGRYPRHPWPENPREADPTLRAKPRK
ncbi:ATP-dependent helicase HrpB [Roseovarius sp. LXJ103]|uniref:ATP-dependent helicase HrpB n=1 Tax=Roseovarius carneus TaxID=2853164 RepID=UPI000D61155C|nr:ATP-dependent helicase HrpB [Roseovarius carneus]MBZ8117116.1 ATP-dependent helicase HrpB [Roseovarius carneus]PWE37040.1 ATP-dependent helicase HrpB [Pelagicola sp. LXJ1103]